MREIIKVIGGLIYSIAVLAMPIITCILVILALKIR